MLEQIKAIVAEALGVEEETLTEETRFQEDLQADSLDLFEMVMTMEDEFDVKIETEELESVKTLGDIMKKIESLKAE